MSDAEWVWPVRKITKEELLREYPANNRPWMPWIECPPRGHERVEIVRWRGEPSPDDCEPMTIKVSDQRPEWNVYQIYWRPVHS